MRNTDKQITWLLPAVIAGALLTACGSSTSTGGTTTPSTSNPPTSSSSVSSALPSNPATESGSPTASLSCKDFAMTAAHLKTHVDYVSMNIGTTNDSSTYYPDLDTAMAALTTLAPTCEPKAVAALAGLATAIEELKATMQPSTDAATVAAEKAAAAKAFAAGAAAWKAMGMATYAWEWSE